MMWLFEQSLLLVVLGTIAVVVLGFTWLQTGRRPLLYAALACVVLTVCGVLIGRWVVTDREAIDAVLRQMAREVERNDLDAVLQHVHSQSPQIRARASAEFPQYQFESVSIKSNLQITVDQAKNPPEAVAKFNVLVVGSLRDQSIQHSRALRYVVVSHVSKGRWPLAGIFLRTLRSQPKYAQLVSGQWSVVALGALVPTVTYWVLSTYRVQVTRKLAPP
jgi:hypothetical protein